MDVYELRSSIAAELSSRGLLKDIALFSGKTTICKAWTCHSEEGPDQVTRDRK